MMMNGNGMMSMMVFMFLFGLLLIVLLVLIGIAIVKWLTASPFSAKNREDALEILRTRYAKGEIDRDKFEAMKRDLEK
jgi:putative membrane protein